VKLEDYKKVETTNIDFKVDLEKEKPKSWLKSVSAFANTKGGIILFGVDDKTREEKGITDVVKATEKISELINARIEPLPRYELNYFQEDVKEFFNVKNSRASEILAILLNNNMIENSEGSKYIFKR
jgi:ATP-dependent DNA helicase RecG